MPVVQLGPKTLLMLGPLAITDTLIVTWIIMVFLVISALILTRKMKLIPTRTQNVLELFVEKFRELVISAMGEERGKLFFPLIATMFIFILVCNWIGIIPFVPSPTGDLNTTVGLALIAFFCFHFFGMKYKGVLTYLKGFIEPYPFLLPLNIIGELARPISMSFRLFGNIVGGGLILTIISNFIPLILPGLLSGYFGLFSGLIQAFIFAMLTMAFITNSTS